MLEGRFQTLDADLLAAIEAATPDALKETLRHITADSLDEVRARLRQTQRRVRTCMDRHMLQETGSLSPRGITPWREARKDPKGTA